MYTREKFDQIRASAKARERVDGRWLASASIGLGLGQLAFIRWAEGALPRQTAVTLEGVLFLLYGGLIVWLFFRLQRNRRNGSPRCPKCGAVLRGLSERIAVATGRCDSCGAQVVE